MERLLIKKGVILVVLSNLVKALESTNQESRRLPCEKPQLVTDKSWLCSFCLVCTCYRWKKKEKFNVGEQTLSAALFENT